MTKFTKKYFFLFFTIFSFFLIEKGTAQQCKGEMGCVTVKLRELIDRRPTEDCIFVRGICDQDNSDEKVKRRAAICENLPRCKGGKCKVTVSCRQK